MTAVVACQAALLKSAGFKRRRHSFNRPAHDGVVHVVYFWQAPKEPPAWTEVPGLRERLYGTFRLEFGVYVAAMTRSAGPKSGWVNEYNCQLRKTTGQLMGATGDLWWALDNPEAATWATEALVEHGLPWLAQFPNVQSIIRLFEEHGPEALGMSPAGYLDIADTYRANRQPSEERRTLELYVSTPKQKGHAEYLRNYLRDRGHGDLAELVLAREP